MGRFQQHPELWTVDLLAYAAGVIDSDGTIGIKLDTYAMRTRRVDYGPVYKEKISVKQIEPEAVDLFRESFGGSRFLWTPKEAHHLPLYSWQIVARMATTVLIAIAPYLRIKRRQAELCIELRGLKEESRRARFAYGRGHRGGGRRPEELTVRMAQLRVEILRLNRAEKWLSASERALSLQAPAPLRETMTVDADHPR